MNRRSVLAFALTALAAAGSIALADQSLLAETWFLPRAAERTYSKVLVVGISEDTRARRNFENKFVSHLRGRGIECVTGYSIVPELTNLEDPTGIVDSLLIEKLDAVITVRLVAAAEVGGPGEGVWARAQESEIRVREYIEAALAADTDAKQLVAEVGLWDMTTRSRVWAARTHPQKLSKLRKNAGDIVGAVIYRMKYDGRL